MERRRAQRVYLSAVAMDKALLEHFSSADAPFYFFLTFVQNSKDPWDQIRFSMGRVNDWFRFHPEICKSWFIVNEKHKDGRKHFHAVAILNYKKFKPSQFKFKIGKQVLRVHIQAKVNGKFISSTFKNMSKAEHCRQFVNGITRAIFDNRKPTREPVPDNQARRTTCGPPRTLVDYISKEQHVLDDLERWVGWSCSCRVDHTRLINIFPNINLSHPILKEILSFCDGNPQKVSNIDEEKEGLKRQAARSKDRASSKASKD